MCHREYLIKLQLFGYLWALWTWRISKYLIRFGKFCTIIYLNKISVIFFHSSPSGTPIICRWISLMVSHRSCRLALHVFILFSCIPEWIISKVLSSNSQILLLGSFWCSWHLLDFFLFHSLCSLEFHVVLFYDFSSVKLFLNFVHVLFSCFCWLVFCVFLYSLKFLETDILNSISGKSQNSMSLGLVIGTLLWSFGFVMFPNYYYFFNIPWSLALLS